MRLNEDWMERLMDRMEKEYTHALQVGTRGRWAFLWVSQQTGACELSLSGGRRVACMPVKQLAMEMLSEAYCRGSVLRCGIAHGCVYNLGLASCEGEPHLKCICV